MALPCETYLDTNSVPYASVPDCCFWTTNKCGGCPWLLSGKPGTTTQCLTRQFKPTSSEAATCPSCSQGYHIANSTNNICCWTSDPFDTLGYCSTVSACLCTASQTHAITNPMLSPTSSTTSPLQCVNSCKTLFSGGPYYQLAGDTCVDVNAFANTCPTALTNAAGKTGTQRTLIQDAVCDIALDLTSVNGSTTLASELNNSYNVIESDDNKYYKAASIFVWVGLVFLLLGFWGNKAYTNSKI